MCSFGAETLFVRFSGFLKLGKSQRSAHPFEGISREATES